MEKRIYNFLDRIVGHNVKCILVSEGTNWKHYMINSDKKIRILEFRVFDGDEKVAIFRDAKLCDMVSGFFGIDEQESAKYIKYWFGDTHNLNKVKDILKFTNLTF